MNISLRIDRRRINDWKDFRDVTINVERSLETYNVSVRIENIELYGDDFRYFYNVYQTDTYRRLEAEVSVGNFVLRGIVDTDSIKIGDGRLVMSLIIDEKSILERDVGGILARKTDDALCILERRSDVVAVMVLLVAAVFYLELAVRQIKEVKSEIAEAIALAASGAPFGTVAGGTLKAAKIILRLAYLAIIVVAFVQVFKRLMEYFPKPIKQPAMNIVRSIRRALNNAGYILETPPEYDKLWLIGEIARNYEVIELIRLLQEITNSRLIVANKVVKFVPRGVVPFPYANRAYTEFWRFNTNEIVGRQVVSLTVDLNDFRAAKQAHNVEIIYDKIRGYSKKVLPASTAYIKADENFFDRVVKDAYEFYRRAVRITKGKLIEYQTLKGKVMLAEEYYVPKLLYADNLVDIPSDQNERLLNFIAEQYEKTNLQAKVYFAKMYLSVSEFLSLYEAGWPGVRRLQYNPHLEVAEVEYELPASFVNTERRTIIR